MEKKEQREHALSQETDKVTFDTLFGMPSVAIQGPFDFMSAKIDTFVDEQIAQGGTSVVLDLRAAYYISAEGLATIFKLVKKMRAINGLLHVCGATQDMAELLSFANIDTYISFVSD